MMKRVIYVSPRLVPIGLEAASAILQSSPIKFSGVDGVTVAPWEDVIPDGKDEKDHTFDVSFE